jgi:lysophospholipase L1-like esterase
MDEGHRRRSGNPRFNNAVTVRCQSLSIAAGAALALSCGGPRVEPSPPLDPTLSCPADISALGHNGVNPVITFDVPVASNGTAPVTVACSPESGSQFNSDVTTVSCVATDVRGRRGVCNFSVTVTPIPQLSKTTFLAFGDSLTEGVLRLTDRSGISIPNRNPPVFNTAESYVEQLYRKMASRYQDQTVTIIAEGYGGMKAIDDERRERDELDQFKPDALLLLEGTNDLLNLPTSAGIINAADALQRMVQAAKARGVTVFLATLPQMNPGAPNPKVTVRDGAPAVALLSDRIRTIAAVEHVTLVDLFEAIPVTQIGDDGVHLKAGGYGIMADEWFKAIMATMEVKPTTPQ